MSQQATPTLSITESVEATWGLDRIVGGCQNCGKVHLVSKDWIGKICPYCARGKIEEQPAPVRQDPPELLLPFRLGQTELRNVYAQFTSGVWLSPDDFNPDALFRRTLPVFWPMWLVDSDIAGNWQAEMGFDYQVKSSVEAYHAGRWVTQPKIETRIRWETRVGTLERRYDNVTIPALEDHAKITASLGVYPLEKTKPYQTEDAGGAFIRLPDLENEDLWQPAQKGLNQQAEKECRDASGAQHSRNFSIQAEYRDQHWSQLLLPMFVTYYSGDNNEIYPVLINGQTGQIHGIRAASQKKGWLWAGISAGLAIGLFILGLILSAIPPITLIGMVFIILAFLLGVFAILPAVWPWQWNRKQKQISH
ncbi:MAG: hypothetical protein IT308_11545 [Anaerolineaceae bacterium]|nr:hypothetical protein [Anaerolineaceae bacterium]